MARTVAQLRAWAELLELCEDECEVIRTTRTMRDAVIEVERELRRLHEIEKVAAEMARALARLEAANERKDDAESDVAMDALWTHFEPPFTAKMRVLVPEAFDGP